MYNYYAFNSNPQYKQTLILKIMRKETITRYLDALSNQGKHTEALFYIQEKLTSDEAEILVPFIGWLGDNEASLGPNNFMEKINTFLLRTSENDRKDYTDKFSEMAKIEREITRKKRDKFEEECLNPGENIFLHHLSYPLKNCVVVSYDPKTKEVVLKLK